MPASLLRRISPAIALCLALAAPLLPAAEPAAGFLSSLVPATWNASGLDQLTAAEKTSLDALVARDVAAARQGGVTAFRGTFSTRRTPVERTQAGMDRLSPAELHQLDESVAATLATRPLLVAKPSRPADTAGIDVSAALKPEIHGRVTLGYAWSERGSDRFGSVETYYYDPTSRVTLGLGISTGRGSGRGCFGY